MNSQSLCQVALRLREFATVRAMECHALSAAAAKTGGDSAAMLDVAIRAGQGVESGRPCKLLLRTAQVFGMVCEAIDVVRFYYKSEFATKSELNLQK